MKNVQEIIGINDAADFLGKNPVTFARYYRNYGVPFFVIGREVRFRKNELMQWILENEGKNEPTIEN